ncbi:unnamed protein product [Choristocarpus tenellus]
MRYAYSMRVKCSTRLRGSRENVRGKINRVKQKLRSNDDQELIKKLKGFIMYLRQQDPQFRTEDAMRETLAQGMTAKAAKLKSRLEDIKENPFRNFPDDEEEDSEDMSWGFDKSFYKDEEPGDNDNGDWNEI